MKYSRVANLKIFEFLRPEIKFDFLFWSLLVAYILNFHKSLGSSGWLKYSKILIVRNDFYKMQSPWLRKQKVMMQDEI